MVALLHDFSYGIPMGKSPKQLSTHLDGLFPTRRKFLGTQESLRSAMKEAQVKAKEGGLLPVTSSAVSCSLIPRLTSHPGLAEETALDQGVI